MHFGHHNFVLFYSYRIEAWMHMNASAMIKNHLFAGFIQGELSDRPTTFEIMKIRYSKHNLK